MIITLSTKKSETADDEEKETSTTGQGSMTVRLGHRRE
jgi:hypothetical protein